MVESKYKCLIVDHDDTCVDSTVSIHYPSFVEAMKILRPNLNVSLQKFTYDCFKYDFIPYIIDVLKLTKEEREIQYGIWRKYHQNKNPDFFEGIDSILVKFKELGGVIVVASHSESSIIEKNYSAKASVMPDHIYDFNIGEDKTKPNPFVVYEILKKYNIKKEEILVVDDARCGLEMAKNAGVDFVCAGWAHKNDEVIRIMKKKARRYLKKVDQLNDLIFV